MTCPGVAGCWNVLSQQFLFRNVKKKLLLLLLLVVMLMLTVRTPASLRFILLLPILWSWSRLWFVDCGWDLLWRNSWWETGGSTQELTPDFSSHAVLHIIHQLTTSWHQPLKMSPDLPYPQPVSLVYSACHKYRAWKIISLSTKAYLLSQRGHCCISENLKYRVGNKYPKRCEKSHHEVWSN